MNKVFLIGRLTRNPELRYSASNMAITRMSLAVDRQFVRDGEERGTDFISMVAFGQRAETMKKYLTKGSQIGVSGRIQTGSYDGQDGKKVYTTDVVVEEFQFLDSKGSRPQDDSSVTPYDFPTNETSSNNSEENSGNDNDPFADFGATIEADDNELPF